RARLHHRRVRRPAAAPAHARAHASRAHAPRPQPPVPGARDARRRRAARANAAGLRRGRDRARDRPAHPAAMIGPEDEAARVGEPGAAGFGDAVTFAFGDPARNVYGSARLGLARADAGTELRASGLGLLFRGGQLVAVDAVGGIELADADADWSTVEAGDVRATVEQPLQAWQVAYDGDDGGFELRFEALSAPAELGDGAVAASAAGLRGYEQVCRVSGTVCCGEERLRVECLGQRGHQWGAPDWERIALARTVSAWFDDGSGVALASVRPHDAVAHADEAVSAFLLAADGVT